jgi:hypothetical protein
VAAVAADRIAAGHTGVDRRIAAAAVGHMAVAARSHPVPGC